jgi:PAS domain S-box-containing protein
MTDKHRGGLLSIFGRAWGWVDRSVPLVLKVGVPTVTIAGMATAAVGRKLIEVTGGHQAEEALIVLALGTGGIAVSCVVILYAFVLRRTSRLARVAKLVAQGKFDFRLPEGDGPRGHDALYNFSRSFDRMVRALDQRAWAVAQAEERYRTMVERIPAVAYTAELGGKGRWSYVAPQIKSILGYSAEAWQADPTVWTRQLHMEDAPMIVARREGMTHGEDHLSMEYRMYARDGRVVWIHDEAAVVRDESGEAKELQGVLYDITERREAEETLKQAYEQERQVAQRLRGVDEMKNSFLTAVSHELRTPLASVLGYAITMSQEDIEFPEEERRDMMSRLLRNAKRLEMLLADLLDVDRMSRGILEPKRHPTNLAELAQRVLEHADLHDREVDVDIDQVTLDLDAPMVERILENLLMNAGKHTPAGSAIKLSIQQVEDGAVIAVDDQGAGVPDALKETVFLPFERGPEAPQHAPGTGIGLSLVSRFAELHGGRAWVDDAPGGGASFRVFLPAVSADQQAVPVAG